MLSRLRKRRLFLQALLIVAFIVGPVGNLGALQSLENDCGAACPCDAEEAEADPCADEHEDEAQHSESAHEPAEHEPGHADTDDCASDCEDCDCQSGVTTAVAPNQTATSPGRTPDAGEAASSARLLPACALAIFIPPIA